MKLLAREKIKRLRLPSMRYKRLPRHRRNGHSELAAVLAEKFPGRPSRSRRKTTRHAMTLLFAEREANLLQREGGDRAHGSTRSTSGTTGRSTVRI